MVIQKKLGNIFSTFVGDRYTDKLQVEWFETNRRILHKKTNSDIAVTIKFLQENPNLKDGDILWMDEKNVIVIEIKTCRCIVITPDCMLSAFSICYEIGNKHLPLFYHENELLIAFEEPFYNLLLASGYPVKVEERKLENALKTSVSPHVQAGDNSGLFNKILRLTNSQ